MESIFANSSKQTGTGEDFHVYTFVSCAFKLHLQYEIQ